MSSDGKSHSISTQSGGVKAVPCEAAAASLGPYPEYRDLRLEWLERIPQGWEVKKLKFIARIQPSNVDKNSEAGEAPVRLCNYVDVYYNECITEDIDFMQATASPEEILKFPLRKGDVLITKDSEEWTDIAVPSYVTADMDGVLCGYHLSIIRPGPNINGKFLMRALQSNAINYQFRIAANGVSRYGLSSYWIANALVVVPPIEDQRDIVSFLDRKIEDIDELVKKKKDFIRLLHEKRLMVVRHLTTKGFDGQTPLVETGYGWLGQIPKHWKLIKMKYVVRSFGGGTPSKDTKDYWNGDIPWVSAKDMKCEVITDTEDHITPEGLANSSSKLVPPGSVLMVVRSGILKHSIPVAVNALPVTINQDMKAFCPTGELDSDYLMFLIVGSQQHLLRIWRKEGTTVESIEYDLMSNTKMPIPPIDEQRTIVEKVRYETEKIDDLIFQVDKAIQLLEGYRQSLIDSAVLGKIDVREGVP